MADNQDILNLEIATPAGLQLHAECEAVQAPSVRGEFGVLPNHVPLLASLRAGVVKYRTDGRDHVVAVGPGFVEAEPDKVLLLTDLFARPEDVDTDSVRKELEEAEKKLAEFEDLHEGPEFRERKRDVDWAQARLEAVEQREHM